MKNLRNLKSFFASKIKESSTAFVISVFLIFIFIMSTTALAVWMNWKSSVCQNNIKESKGVKEYLIGDEDISDKYFLKKPTEFKKSTKLTSAEISNLIDKPKVKTNEEKTIFNMVPNIFVNGWDRSENFTYKEECQNKIFFANGSLGYCDIKSLVNSIFISWEKENKENAEKKFMDDRILINIFEFPDGTYAFPKNIVESYHLSSQLQNLQKITFKEKLIQRYEMPIIYKLEKNKSEIIKEEYYLDAFSIDKFVITLFYDKNYKEQADNITRETILRNIDNIEK
jgi:hypothetical protein